MRTDFQLGRPSGDARIVVAMSGGVDSSVTAALAAATGAEVIGVTLQLYDHGAAVRRPGACCAGQDIYDAKQVADRLGIAHYVLDYESRFREGVIDRFVDEYARGRDAGAVRLVQPGGEVRRPARLRARARRRLPRHRSLCAARGERRPRRAAQGRRPARATRATSSTARRASSSISCASRSATCRKDEVRRIAAELGLEVAAKPDSQDICFVPDGDYAALVEARCGPRREAPGEIVDLDGRVLGRHRGVVHFTVGQRRGIEIGGQPSRCTSSGSNPSSGGSSSGRAARSRSKRMRVADWNWIGEDQREVSVKVRSLASAVPADARRRMGALRPAGIWRRSRAGGGRL